jgi:phthiocerol/phenolphthiocerol synthesis type-I polyketide synthase E
MATSEPGGGMAQDLAGAVAVIGMAGRFPGARSVEEYWENLCAGLETIARFTAEQLEAAGVSRHVHADERYVPARGVVGGADLFDAGYFAMSAREAEVTDPQQRLFLECAEEALQDAGYDSARLRSSVGVFAGGSAPSYLWTVRRRFGDLDLDPMLASFGNETDFLATRVAYKLNLAGPAITIQSACSTGLVAIHLACQSLLNGECAMAVAGASSIQFPEETGYWYEPGSIASPDGRCRAFDAAAQGTVGGNGCGAVVLKALADAVRDGDDVRCVVLGSAVNNDGSAKVGFTAPSVRGQRNVIRRALAAAGVPAASIAYVEAHGTGTALGDPIEVAALAEALGDRGSAPPRLIGSVKPNIGHLDAAAGLAGFIKAAFVVERGVIPPTLHFQEPNPEARLAERGFAVAAAATPWPAVAAPRRAGVSSFGIGGTNAHAILQEPPAREASAADGSWQVLPLSAASPETLDRFAGELARHLGGPDVAALPDVAYTLQVGRRELEHRLVVVAATTGDAESALSTRDPAAVIRGRHGGASPPRVAFAFPGQGTEHAGMAREPAAAHPVFAAHLRECLAALARSTAIDLEGFLLAPAPPEAVPAGTAIAQPALFAFQYALARLWLSWGVRPASLLGHSVGELTAATIAGVLGLDDAARAVVRRGELMQATLPGAMRVVHASAGELEPLLPPQVAIAAVNAPGVCVVSGPADAVERLAAVLAGQRIRSSRLGTARAFHSPSMEAAARAFETVVRGCALRSPSIPFPSTVTGTWISDAEATAASHWAAHVRQPVRFADACRTLLDRGVDIVLEVGAAGGLAALVRANAPPDRPAPLCVASQPDRPGVSGPAGRPLARAAGQLWANGVPLDWPALHAPQRRRRARVPTYPFDRARYSLLGSAVARPPAGGSGAHPPAGQPAAAHPRTPLATPYQPPRSGIQSFLAGVFEEVLGVVGPGAADSFFELGGDSLMAIRVLSRIHDRYSIDVPGEAFFAHPTVAGLEAAVNDALEDAVRCMDPDEVSELLRQLDGGHDD